MRLMIYKLFYFFVIIVKSNILLYKLNIFFRNRNVYDRLPSKKFDLFLTGYQRSGNTFSSRIVNRCFTDSRVSTHFHTIASIKMALSNKIPIIVIVRSPDDSVTSSIVRSIGYGEKFDYALKALYEYRDYYKFLKSHPEVNIIKFTSIIKEPFKLIGFVGEVIGEQVSEEKFNSDKILESVKNELKSDSRNASSNTWYSQEKELKKEEILKEIISTKVYKDCTDLYEAVIKTALF